MALVSPGLEITVTDESQYLPTAVGTVPFVLLATSENKTINGVTASGTLKANAGKIYGVSSQRELATTFGYPRFRQSSTGTPLHGNELNEYGLMAAYSALGLGNRVWIMRADVDLEQLVGTSIRPTGRVGNGTVWFDIKTTDFGLFEYDRGKNAFNKITPLVITSANDCIAGTTQPKASIGNIGDYAVVLIDFNNFVYQKDSTNTWNQVGSAAWSNSINVVESTTSTVNLPAGSSFIINGTTVNVAANITTMTALATLITNAAITGITATVTPTGRLAIAAGVTAAAGAGTCTISGSGTPVNAGSFVVGQSYIIQTVGTTNFTLIGASANTVNVVFTATGAGTGTGTAILNVAHNLSSIGIVNAVYGRAVVNVGGYAAFPAWSVFDTPSSPSKSVWVKTSSLGNGASFVVKRYSTSSSSWTPIAMPVFTNAYTALAGLDPAGGGINIAAGSGFVKYDSTNSGVVSYGIYTLSAAGQTRVTGTTPGVFTVGDTFSVVVSVPGTATPALFSCTLAGTGAADFVAAILAQNVPNVTAIVESAGTITITHRAGGIVTLNNTTVGGRNPVSTAGFTTSTPGVVSNIVNGTVNLTNWRKTTYTFSANEPFTAPANGTMWYFNDATQVDIMVCDTNGWRGYRQVARDSRGYNLTLTDPNGVIISPTEPTTQSGGTGAALVPGDLWLDSSDLENYPHLYRYSNSNTWDLLDNSDSVSQNGIIFADARWDGSGTTDPVTGSLPDIRTLLNNNYVDLDAPDFRLYPRGILLFNTRRSGFGVKKYVVNYFNSTSFTGVIPTQTSAWVSALYTRSNGIPYMGHYAQRQVIVQAMKAALDGNTDIREEGYAFNLLASPGYPELISNLIMLNNDRANTGFIIGDTPMDLSATITNITDYNRSVTIENGFVGLYYPSALTTDLAGNEIAVPASHMMLRTFLHSDNLSYQWFAPAGTRRGLVDNANAIGFIDQSTGSFVRTGLNQQMRDAMYELRINPVTLLAGTGIVAYGQKTRISVASSTGSALAGGTSMDRINVARLVNYLRTVLNGVANQFLFEPNDKITRDQIKQLIESVLNDLIAKRGLYDYLVVCDTTNNTPDRIARNELYVDIAIEPMKDVEFIYIPIRLKNPGTITGESSAGTTNTTT